MTDEFGTGLGIWFGSIFDCVAAGDPVWPIAGEMVVIDWLGGGGGIPNILGGCSCPVIGGGTAAWCQNKKNNQVFFLTRNSTFSLR